MTDEVDTDEVHDEQETSPDEALFIELRVAFEVLALRQGEALRLAQYVQERAEDIDNLKRRAREIVFDRLGEVDEDSLDAMVDVIMNVASDVQAEPRRTDDERDALVGAAVEQVAKIIPPDSIGTYVNSVAAATFTPPSVPMLYSSLLVTMVGELESFIGGLTRALFERHPEKLADSDRTFTFSQVTEFADMDEFRAHAIDQSVEKMLRGSLSDWLDYLNRKFQIPRPALSDAYIPTEVVQRRHVIVHAGGRASRKYLEALAKFKHTVELDDELNVDMEYLQTAADQIFVIALSLLSSASFKYVKSSDLHEVMEAELANRSFFLLQARRYEAVKLMREHVPWHKMSREGSTLVGTVNGWIALKKLGEFELCRAEVEAFDVSARSEDFQLAKLALLDRVPEAYELAQQMLESEKLKKSHWLTWPLLEDVRKYVPPSADDQAIAI